MTSLIVTLTNGFTPGNFSGAGNFAPFGGPAQAFLPGADALDIGNFGGPMGSQGGFGNDLLAGDLMSVIQFVLSGGSLSGQGAQGAGQGSPTNIFINMDGNDDQSSSGGIGDALKGFFNMLFGKKLPSQQEAVSTMQDFQKQHMDKLGLISFDEMRDIATGKKTSIRGVEVPPEVADAAKVFMGNNAALFQAMESATDGKHDNMLGAGDPDHFDSSKLSQQPTWTGLSPDSFMHACNGGLISPNEPDQYDAVRTICKFQKDHQIGTLNFDQMLEMSTGTLDGKPVSSKVADAAFEYVRNHGALFHNVEALTTGEHDNKMSPGDGQRFLAGL